jgi:FeS assembly SUF system protein
MTLQEQKVVLESAIIAALREIYDPEIPVNIYDLGLIYEISLDDELNAHILMTLTTPNCPVAESLPADVRERASKVEGVKSAEIELTFDPPWTQDMLTEEARLDLGLF